MYYVLKYWVLQKRFSVKYIKIICIICELKFEGNFQRKSIMLKKEFFERND